MNDLSKMEIVVNEKYNEQDWTSSETTPVSEKLLISFGFEVPAEK